MSGDRRPGGSYVHVLHTSVTLSLERRQHQELAAWRVGGRELAEPRIHVKRKRGEGMVGAWYTTITGGGVNKADIPVMKLAPTHKLLLQDGHAVVSRPRGVYERHGMRPAVLAQRCTQT
jgi:hypothetical protein